ncbi:MAG: hypothetical protein JRN26_07045 [Nitrososphaerota archaeon]|jgi:hypothetical protein|nr:hypothetical protein [Nitrososphaerota archaeon]MDG6927395.1 hypothetical protein [Nitrososphaerota archaeon]MDG6931199.1 hypothetical protein [Nitrososphaerota archaeon]MDG6931862.1 hypothetical protein [Nitrososphaerota archaeon]MDG6936618.1 hypothetical protein [Nitrososphaerota archaeon]
MKKSISRIFEETLEQYGEASRKVVIWHLEKTMGLKLDDIESDPRRFLDALAEIYGDLNLVIETSLCENISQEYGIKYRGEGLVKLLKEIKA